MIGHAVGMVVGFGITFLALVVARLAFAARDAVAPKRGDRQARRGRTGQGLVEHGASVGAATRRHKRNGGGGIR